MWNYRWHAICTVAAALALACGAGAQPAQAPAPDTVTLDETQQTVEFDRRRVWSGPDAEASLHKAITGELPWRTTSHEAVHPIARGQALWLHLRVLRSSRAGGHWVLQFPVPVLDAVTLYQQDGRGTWSHRTAGDLLAASAWPEAGRFPFFRLELRSGEPHDLLVRVQHSTPLNLPVRLVTAAEHDRRMRLEYLGLGMALGALALLVAGSLARAWRLRDPGYAWYGLYALLSMLAAAAFTGIAGHLLWGEHVAWTDAAPGCMAILAGASALWIVRSVTGIVARTRWLGQAIRWASWAGPLLALAYLFVDRRTGIAMAGVFLLTVAAVTLSAAVVTWRRGDAVGRWMLMGSVPLALAVSVALLRVFGWIEASWLTEYALVLALAFDLPMLLGALNSRSRERRGAQLRQLASASQDALTGLLKAKPFDARLTHALLRFHRRGESSAVAVIELANYEWIKSRRGPEAAEESLLRAVIKLRKLVRDVDTTGRIGEARIGLVLEGVSSRQVVAQFASRLVASGLMREPEQPEDPDLQFHIAATLLLEHAPTSAELVRLLGAVLEKMSVRTHRPFRFLETQQSLPAGEDSSALQSESAPLAAS
ncbi:MAG: diguanylate cyclase [Burkholderiales bacterium]|nr:diguanylate cyclase [Burkholderiales bacterium]